jgi:hypothetical protein
LQAIPEVAGTCYDPVAAADLERRRDNRAAALNAQAKGGESLGAGGGGTGDGAPAAASAPEADGSAGVSGGEDKAKSSRASDARNWLILEATDGVMYRLQSGVAGWRGRMLPVDGPTREGASNDDASGGGGSGGSKEGGGGSRSSQRAPWDPAEGGFGGFGGGGPHWATQTGAGRSDRGSAYGGGSDAGGDNDNDVESVEVAGQEAWRG